MIMPEQKKIRFELEAAKGHELADLLNLRPNRSTLRYELTTGDKTSLGLYLTVKRFIEEAEAAIDTAHA